LTRDRILVWDGCVNVRDLGGLLLEGGGETRYGVVVRADSIGTLTDTGWAALVDYGIVGAIDLRGDHELDGADPRVPVTRIPIAPLSGPAWEWPSMLEAYLAMLEEWRPQFAQAVDAIAAVEPPVVLHCQGGRDRTGLVVALILEAVGVNRAAIAADHALSDESFAPFNSSWLDEAPDEDERARRRRITQRAGETMADVLAEVERRYGGPAGYLGTDSIDTIVLRLRG
jgi:protein-tyrosine phosphatase